MQGEAVAQGRILVTGFSGPTLSFQVANKRENSIGPEGPPQEHPARTARAARRPLCDAA
ncbi:DUF6053 domain-containing protein [Lysobacter enzymogenes]